LTHSGGRYELHSRTFRPDRSLSAVICLSLSIGSSERSERSGAKIEASIFIFVLSAARRSIASRKCRRNTYAGLYGTAPGDRDCGRRVASLDARFMTDNAEAGAATCCPGHEVCIDRAAIHDIVQFRSLGPGVSCVVDRLPALGVSGGAARGIEPTRGFRFAMAQMALYCTTSLSNDANAPRKLLTIWSKLVGRVATKSAQRWLTNRDCEAYFLAQASNPIGDRSIRGSIHPACAIIRRISSIG
jgi:hypothetical protein